LPSDLSGEGLPKVLGIIFLRILFWPIILVTYLFKVIGGFDEEKTRKEWMNFYATHNPMRNETIVSSIERMVRYDFALYMESISFFQWLFFIIFGMTLLFIVNQL
jgi:hypothetical protein